MSKLMITPPQMNLNIAEATEQAALIRRVIRPRSRHQSPQGKETDCGSRVCSLKPSAPDHGLGVTACALEDAIKTGTYYVGSILESWG